MDFKGFGLTFPSFADQEEKYPIQLDVAFDILKWAGALERDMNPKELLVYNSALEVLRLYLSGEMTFSDNSQRNNESKIQEKEECFFCKDKS